MDTAQPDFGPVDVPSMVVLSHVRERFVTWAASIVDVPAETMGDLAIVLSELGANAVHASPPGTPPPTICGRIAGTTLTIEASNHVDGRQQVGQEWDPEDLLRPQGRGLLLVAALTDSVTVDAGDEEIAVTCEVRVPTPDDLPATT